VVLVLSALSRAHLARALPRTTQALQAISRSVRFSRFMSVGTDTLSNQLALFHGATWPDPRRDWLWNAFKTRGYVRCWFVRRRLFAPAADAGRSVQVTMHAEEECRYAASVKKHLSDRTVIDHYFSDLFCQLDVLRRMNGPALDAVSRSHHY
jgi:hypothetical protein